MLRPCRFPCGCLLAARRAVIPLFCSVPFHCPFPVGSGQAPHSAGSEVEGGPPSGRVLDDRLLHPRARWALGLGAGSVASSVSSSASLQGGRLGVRPQAEEHAGWDDACSDGAASVRLDVTMSKYLGVSGYVELAGEAKASCWSGTERRAEHFVSLYPPRPSRRAAF